MAKRKADSQRMKNDPLAQQLPLVSARWLVTALVIVFGGGLALVYGTMCLLFWQGQWQVLFKPGHAMSGTSMSNGFPFDDVHFATTEAGKPRLDGWFITAAADGHFAGRTVLYLHDMQIGSLAQAVPELAAMHRVGINVFAFDYRGFGSSEDAHPSEHFATEDTDAAWEYLVDTRHIPAASIVLYGKGLGASLAVEAAARHPDAGAVVLDSPEPTALELFHADPRSQWMPVRLLTQDRFDPTAAFGSVKVPALFLLPPPLCDRPGRRYAERAADPKMIVSLPPGDAESARLEALRRFLDELR